MGYTSYYYRQPELNPQRFATWSAQVKQLREALPNPAIIGAGDGEGGEPEITPERVWLNGVGDESYETFLVEQALTVGLYDHVEMDGTYFGFCKTAKKPYDLLVAASLIQLQHLFPHAVKVSSDGWREEWADAQAFVLRVLGRDAGFMPRRVWVSSSGNPRGEDGYHKDATSAEYDAARVACKLAMEQLPEVVQ